MIIIIIIMITSVSPLRCCRTQKKKNPKEVRFVAERFPPKRRKQRGHGVVEGIGGVGVGCGGGDKLIKR